MRVGMISSARVLLLGSMLVAAASHAGWSLDGSESYLSFVSTKNSDVAEAHAFIELRGDISDDGASSLVVELASVHTLIPIRDERMRDLLFEAGRFPVATFSTQIDLAAMLAMAPGETRSATIVGELDLHGVVSAVRVEVAVVRIGEDRFNVVTRKPFIVLVGSHALLDGIERLREIAGLKMISLAVPVSFSLQFVRD